ncbi:MAG: aldehyde dehydrogenase family protein [Steroidobacteraceae bacterium]|nr:aldehyde dehydrogenase family protein [Steroidobacteraceae bacterium]
MPQSINPATGEALRDFPYLTDSEIETALTHASRDAPDWGARTCAERAVPMRAAATLLRREKAALARTITLEMGKPITEAEAEIDKAAWNCEHVADQAEGWLADDIVETSASLSYVSHLPLGTVLSVLPWNFPVWQIFRSAVSLLVAGNTVLMKHAPNVPECAERVTDLMRRAGFPRGVFQNLLIPVDRIARVIADPRVAAVTLTGSPAAGAAVAAQAGAACKKSLLELGGSDAFIVLDDADLDAAVNAAVKARFANCGQVCLAAKRFIVTPGIAAAFEEQLAEQAARLRVGDPLDRATQLGPMAREDLRQALHRQVQQSLASGARVLTGGTPRAGAGFYYFPTVLAGVTAEMPVATEETFGPVAAILRARDEQHALALANASRYGLSCCLWTRDIDRARALARRIATGGVFINSVSASDPRMPVGGVKLSGYGRELGRAGMREMVNLQSVWIGSPR